MIKIEDRTCEYAKKCPLFSAVVDTKRLYNNCVFRENTAIINCFYEEQCQCMKTFLMCESLRNTQKEDSK